MGGSKCLIPAITIWLLALYSTSGTTVRAALTGDPDVSNVQGPSDAPLVHGMFAPSTECIACHNTLTAATGEDLSIGVAWRASIMANSSRDPYWQASVRRETLDHPKRKPDIEDECARCHMPMMRAEAHASGRHGEVFAHLPLGGVGDDEQLAQDGVSCSLCHQITPEGFGTRQSFVGGFVVHKPVGSDPRTMFGRSVTEPARQSIMRSVTGAQPGEGKHVQQSELCATCHTLITEAFGPDGEVIGSIPEQVPYQEWQHSAFRNERSCQSCHMPRYEQPTRIASVLGDVRDGLSRHTFLGGNFFMLRMLNRFRTELGVVASPSELDASAAATLRQLQQDSATVAIPRAVRSGAMVEVDVDVRNLTGHKLPTGYPSRRAWIHITLRDANGRAVFESGAIGADGRIAGNDGDSDSESSEPHYEEIARDDQVQIYESVMQDRSGKPTTGLLQAVAFAKDNRLLPRGFDKSTAESDIAVRGSAVSDRDFADAGDRIRYRMATAGAAAPFRVDVELRYQPIAYRWAHNLAAYDAAEPKRFVNYYDQLAPASSTVLAQTTVTIQ
jgi:hypothetical protein